MNPDAFDMAQQAAESGQFSGLAPPLQIAIFLGGMVLLTSILVSLTAFTRIVIVLSFVKRALATQEIPPSPVLIGLSLFLTMFVMGPTLDAVADRAVTPMLNSEIETTEAARRAWTELRTFMLKHTRKNDLALFLHLSELKHVESAAEVPGRILVPAFVISELKTAFIMGFYIYIPFLLIDLVVSTVLMSLGMMMMPPVVVSTPFKIMLFVLVDGWHLITHALSLSFKV